MTEKFKNFDGKYFNIPLYHGTSTLFLDSILSNGLGGINLLKAWGVVESYKELFEVVNDSLSDEEKQDLPEFFFVYQYAASQSVTGGGFKFQHGNAYVTPVKNCAFEYANNSRFGSELLRLYEELWKNLNLCRGRNAGHPAPPAQIPASGFPAPGSCLRS